jgi:AcrR family transcriptional regulator
MPTPAKRPRKQITPRKEASQLRSRATIDRIVDATWEMLGISGAKSVSTRSIARVSGVTIGSIYQYFPNKEAILFELFRRRLEVVLVTFDELSTPEMARLSPLEWVERYTQTFDRLGWNQPAQHELDKACRWDARLAKLVETHYEKMRQKLTDLYRQFYPEADETSVRVLAQFIYGIELMEARMLRAESAAGRSLIRKWRTLLLTTLLEDMDRP